MWSCTQPFGSGAARLLGAVACSCVVFTSAALAQVGRPGPPPSGEINPKAASRERQGREARLRSAELLTPRSQPDRMGTLAAIEEVKQDFVHLQTLRNEIARHLLSGKPLDYGFLAEKTAEVHKRADRLSTRLLPRTVEAQGEEKRAEREAPDPERMKGDLVRLCKAIDRFSDNPIFEMEGSADPAESERAGVDLKRIVRLSGDINDDALRLGGARAR